MIALKEVNVYIKSSCIQNNFDTESEQGLTEFCRFRHIKYIASGLKPKYSLCGGGA